MAASGAADPDEELENTLKKLFERLGEFSMRQEAATFESEADRQLITALHQQTAQLVRELPQKVDVDDFFDWEWGKAVKSILVRALASVGDDDAFTPTFRAATAQAQRIHTLKTNAVFRAAGSLVSSRRMSAQIFKDLFGLSEDAVALLVRLSKPRLRPGTTANNLALTAKQRLMIALLHLHNGGRHRMLGMACGVSPDTVRRCLDDAETILFTNPVVPLDYSPKGYDWRQEASCGFAKHVGVRCIILAIDGHKVGCKAPTDRAVRSASFCGSKGPFVTMGYAVDDAQTPRYVMGGHPGSTNDMKSLRESSLWTAMEDPLYYDPRNPAVPLDMVVIGDAAYIVRDWLMVPFKENETELELSPLEILAFNFLLSAARQKVEHFNGRLTQMCAPIRDRGQQRSAAQAVKIARTCAGLMSFGIQYDTLMGTGRLGKSVARVREAGRAAPQGPKLERLDRSLGPVTESDARDAGATNRRRLARAWILARGRSIIVRSGVGGKPVLFWYDRAYIHEGDKFLVDAVIAERAGLGLPQTYAAAATASDSSGVSAGPTRTFPVPGTEWMRTAIGPTLAPDPEAQLAASTTSSAQAGHAVAGHPGASQAPVAAAAAPRVPPGGRSPGRRRAPKRARPSSPSSGTGPAAAAASASASSGDVAPSDSDGESGSEQAYAYEADGGYVGSEALPGLVAPRRPRRATQLPSRFENSAQL